MDELWIAVCDDLEEERRSLARMIHSYAQRRNRTVRFRFYSSGEELLASGQQVAACQILFLDIYMPGLSGVEAARRLRAAGCGTSIVFATTSLDHGLESFDVWAADYLTKPFLMEELEARIRAVLRRTNASAGSKSRVLRSGPLTVDPDRWTAAWRGEPLKLAKREFQLLAALMARPGAVATHEALLRAMGAEDAPDLNALRVGIARLRKRLAEAGMDPAALSSFSGVGYMLGDLAQWDEAELP